MRFLLVLFFSTLLASGAPIDISLQFKGVHTLHKHPNGEVEKVHILRQKPKECVDVHISPKDVFGGDHAGAHVPKECKRTFVTTVGKIMPLHLHEDFKTVAELEVLDFIHNKINKNPDENVLVDSRRLKWFEMFTIPSAVNIPFNHIEYDPDFPEDFAFMLKTLGIKHNDGEFDFTNAKNVIFFCNGAWCGQSSNAMIILSNMGYPAEKMMWYRGGMESWLLHGFSTIKPKF